MSITHRDFSDVQTELLCALYADAGCTLDDLPYTDEFETLYQQFLERGGITVERRFVWKALCNCRKAGRLTRKVR